MFYLNLVLSVNPCHPPHLLLVVFPGVNTGGVGSYVYDKEPSAVTQPWTFVPSASPLFSTQHWTSTTVLFVAFFLFLTCVFIPETTSLLLQISFSPLLWPTLSSPRSYDTCYIMFKRNLLHNDRSAFPHDWLTLCQESKPCLPCFHIHKCTWTQLMSVQKNIKVLYSSVAPREKCDVLT